MSGSAERAAHTFEVTDRYRYTVVGLLIIVGIFSWVDRTIFAILLESIKQEFDFSDTELGMLGGLAFGLFYASVGLPVAWLCDNFNRRNIIAVALGVFSLMTALCGMATGFTSLFLARVGVGIGEAGGSPPSQSMISDYFPPERRAAAMGMFFMYLPLGTLVGYLVGGWVNQFFGWRQTFYVLGIPGVALAVLLLFILKEPPRGLSEKRTVSGPSPSLWSTIKYFMTVPSLRLLPFAGAVHGIGVWGAQLWLPAYFTRVHGLSSGEIGTWFALVFGLGGAAGTLLGGMIVDRIVTRTGDRRWYMWFSAIVILISTPLSVFVYMWSEPYAALMVLFIPTFIMHMFLGPVTAIVQTLSGVQRRAMGAAFYLFLSNLISMGLGPLVIGVTSDFFAADFGNLALRYSLVTLVSSTSVLAALLFFMTARNLREDLDNAQATL